MKKRQLTLLLVPLLFCFNTKTHADDGMSAALGVYGIYGKVEDYKKDVGYGIRAQFGPLDKKHVFFVVDGVYWPSLNWTKTSSTALDGWIFQLKLGAALISGNSKSKARLSLGISFAYNRKQKLTGTLLDDNRSGYGYHLTLGVRFQFIESFSIFIEGDTGYHYWGWWRNLKDDDRYSLQVNSGILINF